MKKNLLKVLFLTGVLAFTLPVVGYCETVNCYSQEIHENARDSKLLCAIKEGDLEEVKFLIDIGANVNCKECDFLVGEHSENTPLIEACGAGNFKIAKLLIENGADVNFVSFDEVTAFDAACRSGNLKLVKLLIENGADINHIDISGTSQLGWACEKGNLELVRILIENGADINACSEWGREPFIIACGAENFEIAGLLVEHGVDFNLFRKYMDPVLNIINKCDKGDITGLMAIMNVNSIEKYKGQYKLDVSKTFGNGKIKAESEDGIQHFGVSEDAVSILFSFESGGGIADCDSFIYLQTAESVRYENIDDKEYMIVVNDGINEYWEKISDVTGCYK